MKNSIKLAVVPGDGIGPEVIAEALKVLEAVAERFKFSFDTNLFSLGAERFLTTGDILPAQELKSIQHHDAILLGAVGGIPGDPRLADANIERELLLKLRFELEHYANLRPCRLISGVKSALAQPGEIDFLIVREGTEGPYSGNGGSLRTLTRSEVATEVSINTAFGTERVVRYAFKLANARNRKTITWIHKTNVLVNAGRLWQRIVAEVAQEFPEVSVEYMHADAATIYMVQDPGRFDVIVTDNLFGDILSDLAGAISGGIGLAASGNINPSSEFPSMFEPVHGTAPDIAGTGKADPTAAILSVAMMLQHFEMIEESNYIFDAVSFDIRRRNGVFESTTQIGDAITQRILGTA